MLKIGKSLLICILLLNLNLSFASEHRLEKIVIRNLDGATVEEQKKLNQALDLLLTTLQSDEFKNEVLNFTYQGKKEFVQNNGLSNAEVYQKLMEGEEFYIPSADYQMDLDLGYYYKGFLWKCGAVGYTTPSTSFIYMNRCWHDQFDTQDIAANIVHEWTHKLGFSHDYKATKRRPFTVPYGVGSIVEKILRR